MTYFELLRSAIPSPQEMVTGAQDWVKSNAKFWGVSLGAHLLLLAILGVAVGAPQAKKMVEVVFFETEVEQEVQETEITQFDVGETPLEPTVLNTESLTEPPATVEQDAQYNDDSAVFEERGGGMATGTSTFGGLASLGTSAIGDGPVLSGAGSLAVGVGTGNSGGSGGDGNGFGGRGSGSREASVASGGGTADTERCVGASVNWLARHQNPDGGWGLTSFRRNCKDPSCVGHLDEKLAEERPMAATAFGLLPFFAAGQTHKSNGPYKAVITKGIGWMLNHQDPKTGRLGGETMYDHGLATIAICEAYGLSKDPALKPRAQAALNFIMDAQNDTTGGWHYAPNPTTVGDTSVVGWQLMALKSGQMAGLQVAPETMEKAKKFLKAVSKGKSGGLFSYMPETGPSPTMSAVGLLCNQYMGMKKSDPAMVEGMEHVMANIRAAETNPYFLYYATQVMHNLPGPEWDKWNRHARRYLISTQIKEGCAAGSWSGKGKPHCHGTVMMTSVCALTLEVYYRYLPLYQIEGKDGMADGKSKSESK